jgi:hypothetical protein
MEGIIQTEGQDISNEIKRRTLRCMSSQQIANDTFAMSGEFGVNSFQRITLEILKFNPNDDKQEILKKYWDMQDYWKKQEGQTYQQLEATIKAKGGNSIELRRFKFNELERLRELIDEYHKRQLTESEIQEANELEKLRRASFGLDLSNKN